MSAASVGGDALVRRGIDGAGTALGGGLGLVLFQLARDLAGSALDRLGGLVFSQRVLRGEEVLLEAEVKVASLRAADFRPCPMDPSLYQELHRLLAGPTP